MSALIIPIIILIACFVMVAKIGYWNLTGKKDNLDAVMGRYHKLCYVVGYCGQCNQAIKYNQKML